MVSRENKVVLLTSISALVILIVFSTWIHVESWILVAMVLLIGFLLPQFINNYLDNKQDI